MTKTSRLGGFFFRKYYEAFPEGSASLPLLLLKSFFQSLRQLVGAGGGLATASGAFQTGDDLIGIHTFYQGSDTLEVAVTAADKLHILYLAVFDIKQNPLRASAESFVFVHIILSFLEVCFIIRQPYMKFKYELIPRKLVILFKTDQEGNYVKRAKWGIERAGTKAVD